MGLFKEKSTFRKFIDSITNVLEDNPDLGIGFLDELEESLVVADVGVETAERIVEELNETINSKRINSEAGVKAELASIIEKMVDKGERNKLSNNYPLVVLLIGINGGGKTTSIGKIAHMLKSQGKSVMLAAADTFRAAASEQLILWGERVGVRVIAHGEGTDPSAVIYDSIQAAKANNVDVLLCDTAGRLQNKGNLMKELEKMSKVISKEYPEASRENLLILDATTGKNAVSQAKEFSDITDVTGIILTKMDGTARGGISITLADEYDLPIKYIGMGEGIDDLIEFDAKEFAGGIFDE
ncbi:MAG: signal recognition particle-docking protein FtsY [Clostridiales bacterium]|jgi:fused signal recognition particle receptor|nr:signal recognition particle-docking protein FtsY [Clostridiales bacterium]